VDFPPIRNLEGFSLKQEIAEGTEELARMRLLGESMQGAWHEEVPFAKFIPVGQHDFAPQRIGRQRRYEFIPCPLSTRLMEDPKSDSLRWMIISPAWR
jgi:hypothetical protein